jgi:hypothetical protein
MLRAGVTETKAITAAKDCWAATATTIKSTFDAAIDTK